MGRINLVLSLYLIQEMIISLGIRDRKGAEGAGTHAHMGGRTPGARKRTDVCVEGIRVNELQADPLLQAVSEVSKGNLKLRDFSAEMRDRFETFELSFETLAEYNFGEGVLEQKTSLIKRKFHWTAPESITTD